MGTLRVPMATSPSGGGKAGNVDVDGLQNQIQFSSNLNVVEPKDQEAD